MDEAAYRKTLQATHPLLCPFSKAMFSACVACPRAGRMNLAERELIVCDEAGLQKRCTRMHDALRHNFGFAIHILHDEAPIPHAQEMRIQCGGLRGLQDVLRGDAEVKDVDELMCSVLQRWPEEGDIPFSEVVHAAHQHYQGRHSR
jgi:hypothetical protein